jgi:hypothetical protein
LTTFAADIKVEKGKKVFGIGYGDQEHEIIGLNQYYSSDAEPVFQGEQVEVGSENEPLCLNHRPAAGWSTKNITVNYRDAEGSHVDKVAYMSDIGGTKIFRITDKTEDSEILISNNATSDPIDQSINFSAKEVRLHASDCVKIMSNEYYPDVRVGGDSTVVTNTSLTVNGSMKVSGTATVDTIKANEVDATNSYNNNIQGGKKSNHLSLENQYGKITLGETVISDSGMNKTVSNVVIETKPPNQTGYSILDLKGDTVNVFSDRQTNLSRWNGDGIPVKIPGVTTMGIVNCSNVNCNIINGENWSDLMTRIGALEATVAGLVSPP